MIKDKKALKKFFKKNHKNLLVKKDEEFLDDDIAWIQTIGKNAYMGTLGNISSIIGKAKSRKSFLMNIVSTTLLSNDKTLEQFENRLPKNKRTILYFDTEQGRKHVHLALKRIHRHTGLKELKELKVFSLRTLNTVERLKFIEYEIMTTPNLGYVIIDGIRDLIKSINDEAEATEILDFLLKWSAKYHIHIMVVLHQNKGNSFARGHIGTELTNKAETVFEVKVSDIDKEVSIVEAIQSRNISPEIFAFRIDDNGIPELCDIPKGKLKFTLSAKDKNELMIDAFETKDILSYGNLLSELQDIHLAKFKRSLSEMKAKKIIKGCKEQQIILQNISRGPYTLNPDLKKEAQNNYEDELPF